MWPKQLRLVIATFSLLAIALCSTGVKAQLPSSLDRWLGPQEWKRDTDGPVISLGKEGEFDDTHLLAAMVAKEGDKYFMWYGGSSGFAHDLAGKRLPDKRVYKLGLATSNDGKHFEKHPDGAVFGLNEGTRSVLTPSILRNPDGTLLRVDGKIRMWFSSANLGGGGRPHSIQSAESEDGIHWTNVSPDLITRAYCPTVIKEGDEYRMWYTEPGAYPWVMRHARSPDGLNWTVDEKTVIEETQDWEHFVFNYPTVTKIGDVYLMWYVSYATEDKLTTAIGFAVSEDGLTWHKHPQNPVLRPDPSREWESHYVSCGSTIRMPDGSFRMWYFARKEPPFLNLYYALGTATWAGPKGL
ncbi:MAG: hypothetical protein WD851_01255 [Pirellulales bacterium]